MLMLVRMGLLDEIETTGSNDPVHIRKQAIGWKERYCMDPSLNGEGLLATNKKSRITLDHCCFIPGIAEQSFCLLKGFGMYHGPYFTTTLLPVKNLFQE